MGLLDKIKQKRTLEEKSAPPAAGKQLTVSSEEEFIETCKDLTSDFAGILFLTGDAEGESYSASIIVEHGAIIGATFELGGLILFREQAIDDMKDKLRGSKGTLNIYEFEPEDMQHIRESNKAAFTTGPQPISSLGLKLTLLVEEEQKQEGGIGLPAFGASPQERRTRPHKVPSLLKEKGTFNLLELARKPESIKDLPKEAPKIDLAKKADDDELPDFAIDKMPDEGEGFGLPSLGGIGGDRKLEEMRRIKEERQKKVADWLAVKNKKREEEQREEAASGKPIQTPIDRLYSLVKKYQKLRIDDKLAHTLGVSRTQIEEWAVILEEHDLIELHYPTIGEPEIRVKGEAK